MKRSIYSIYINVSSMLRGVRWRKIVSRGAQKYIYMVYQSYGKKIHNTPLLFIIKTAASCVHFVI
jgi:hypothetical protein